jgi:hypothetical protein
VLRRWFLTPFLLSGRYSFPAGSEGWVHFRVWKTLTRGGCNASSFAFDPPSGRLAGVVHNVGSYSGRFGGFRLFFAAAFSDPPLAWGVWQGRSFRHGATEGQGCEVSGDLGVLVLYGMMAVSGPGGREVVIVVVDDGDDDDDDDDDDDVDEDDDDDNDDDSTPRRRQENTGFSLRFGGAVEVKVGVSYISTAQGERGDAMPPPCVTCCGIRIGQETRRQMCSPFARLTRCRIQNVHSGLIGHTR